MEWKEKLKMAMGYKKKKSKSSKKNGDKKVVKKLTIKTNAELLEDIKEYKKLLFHSWIKAAIKDIVAAKAALKNKSVTDNPKYKKEIEKIYIKSLEKIKYVEDYIYGEELEYPMVKVKWNVNSENTIMRIYESIDANIYIKDYIYDTIIAIFDAINYEFSKGKETVPAKMGSGTYLLFKSIKLIYENFKMLRFYGVSPAETRLLHIAFANYPTNYNRKKSTDIKVEKTYESCFSFRMDNLLIFYGVEKSDNTSAFSGRLYRGDLFAMYDSTGDIKSYISASEDTKLPLTHFNKEVMKIWDTYSHSVITTQDIFSKFDTLKAIPLYSDLHDFIDKYSLGDEKAALMNMYKKYSLEDEELKIKEVRDSNIVNDLFVRLKDTAKKYNEWLNFNIKYDFIKKHDNRIATLKDTKKS